MYHNSVTKWSPIEEDERVRRDNMTGSSVHQLPPYVSRSPTLNHYSGSSTNGHHPSTAHPTYSSRPSSSAAMPASINIAQSPRLGPPPSPTNGLLNLNRPAAYTPSTSTYYDPTSEHRESTAAWAPSPRPAYSPMQVRKGFDVKCPNDGIADGFLAPRLGIILRTQRRPQTSS